MLSTDDNYSSLLYAAAGAADRDSPTLRHASSARQLISVEEGMDCRQANSRFFSMCNFQSKLSVILSLDSSIISCKLAGHEIVLDTLLQLRQTHKTWAIGSRPYQKLAALPWNCHVRGQQLLLTTASQGVSSMVYELTCDNELHSVAKLKSVHLQHQTVYFNLNSAKDKAPIDGHTLVVQCNGNLNRIRTQNTKLLCGCNQHASVLPQSLVGEIPFELVQHQQHASLSSSPAPHPHNVSGSSAPDAALNLDQQHDDDVIVCDSIFSLEPSSPTDYLRVRLQYNQRALEFELRTSPQQPVTNHQAGAGAASTTASVSPANSSTSQTTPSTNVSSSTLRLALRVRVRVTNFGVCIMPIMMSNYASTHRFIW